MALTPAHDDAAGQAELKAGNYNSGAVAQSTDPLVNRVMVMAAAHFGLTQFEMGRISNIAKKHLDAAGGNTSRLDVEAMRADIGKLIKVPL